ncbi:MAG: glycosyltransferase [Candidatus Brocadiaceae bacterium]|nr:glycosyltransferase [Candidatus Brocadiaceae bacterium]
MRTADLRFSSNDYLPGSEERIEHLRRIIHGRPVAILAAGPSIKELEKRIEELRYADICYFGMNSFLQEKHIIQKINKHVSVFFRSCREGMPEVMKDIITFLKKDEDNMFVSSFHRNTFELLDNSFELNSFLGSYDKKLLFFGISYDRTLPDRERPLHFISGNSLQILIQLAIIGKASGIVLFGADGSSKMHKSDKIGDLWYRFPDYYSHWKRKSAESLFLDTTLCFNPILPVAIRNTCKTYKIPPIAILNCSENSGYTPVPTVTYQDAFDFLLNKKKIHEVSDLRVPKISIITPVMTDRDYLHETIESVASQSYTNREHIIVYDKNVEHEIQDLVRQCENVRFISDNNSQSLQSFKKGVLTARGEYLYYCPEGDLYANQDWINICMEILENHADISLVWGLSQIMAENGAAGRITDSKYFDNPPPQSKGFIYHWLRHAYSFPVGSFCVRKKVLENCFPFNDTTITDIRKAWFLFNYHFNKSGYLPFFVPLVVNYQRTYFDQGGHRPQGDPVTMHLPYYVPITEEENVQHCASAEDTHYHLLRNEYRNDIVRYKKTLVKEKNVHCFRNGAGEVLQGGFNRVLFLFSGCLNTYKKVMPGKWIVAVENALCGIKKRKWSIVKSGLVRLLLIIFKKLFGKRSLNSIYKIRDIGVKLRSKDSVIVFYCLAYRKIKKIILRVVSVPVKVKSNMGGKTRENNRIFVNDHKMRNNRIKPHILFVTEKWRDHNPKYGLSNSEHNLYGSLDASCLATHERIHPDEYLLRTNGSFDNAVILKCLRSGPDALCVTWPAHPKLKTLGFIKNKLNIPVIAIWWDSVNHMEEAESFLPFVNINLVVDSSTAFLGKTQRPEQYLPLWTPEDPSLFYNPGIERDINVSFAGTVKNYPDRVAGIFALKSKGIDVYQTGGQRENTVSVDEYALVYKRSKIALNFCYHNNGVPQTKGRIFEATLCGAMLLEAENAETARYFEPMIDYVSFSDEADLVEKVRYYLAHDPERMEIAERGHKKAKERYTGKIFWETVLARVMSENQ